MSTHGRVLFFDVSLSHTLRPLPSAAQGVANDSHIGGGGPPQVGFVGGSVATSFNAPLDVAKSRIQSQRLDSGTPPKYTSTAQTLALIVRCATPDPS